MRKLIGEREAHAMFGEETIVALLEEIGAEVKEELKERKTIPQDLIVMGAQVVTLDNLKGDEVKVWIDYTVKVPSMLSMAIKVDRFELIPNTFDLPEDLEERKNIYMNASKEIDILSKKHVDPINN